MSKHAMRVFNIMLRLISLTAKLVLTLYMGRFLSLSDMGTYGVVVGVVMVFAVVLGVRFDYITSRASWSVPIP